MMRRFLLILFVMTLAAVAANAQADYAARQRTFSLTAGGMFSGFDTDYHESDYYGTHYVLGGGAFVDVRLTHWVQLEAEGRWMRIPSTIDSAETEDNYLIGPRVPLKKLWKFDTYGKALIGIGKMNFPQYDPTTLTHGTYTDIAAGATAEYRLNKRWSIRALDLEYQFWPPWPSFPCRATDSGCPVPNGLKGYGKTLSPFGVSVGIGYRIF